jgi:uncharacterized protein
VAHQDRIEPAGCRQLLAAASVGRLAVVDQGRPALVVLNHAVDGDDVLFRTAEGSMLARLTHHEPVPAVFEVDSAFPPGRSGWSVIAKGNLLRESHPARWARARAKIATWAAGERDVVLRLEVGEVTGRHVGGLPPA